MEPAFFEGDHVLTFNWVSSKKRDVVVFSQNNNYFLKRVERLRGDLIWVLGDNREMSSRLASIKKTQVIGRVVLKY